MKVEYDNTVDSKYISFKKGSVKRTEPMKDWLILDYAADDTVIGIEILDASEHDIGISTIGGEFVGIFETQPVKRDIPKMEIPEDRIDYKNYKKDELVQTN